MVRKNLRDVVLKNARGNTMALQRGGAMIFQRELHQALTIDQKRQVVGGKGFRLLSTGFLE